MKTVTWHPNGHTKGMARMNGFQMDELNAKMAIGCRSSIQQIVQQLQRSYKTASPASQR